MILPAVLLIIFPMLVFVLPGLALLALVGGGQHWGFNQRVIVACGLSIALYPLLLLYARLLNVRFGSGLAWATLALAAAVLAWDVARAGGLARLREWRAGLVLPEDWLPGVMLWGTFAVTLGVRLWVVRDLAVPKWGDSYHHTVITQLLIDHGGLFTTWEPYAPMQSFTYHYAFHAVSAFFAWIIGLDAIRAVILGAQWLNALAALVMYPFTLRITGNRWAAAVAVLAAGLLLPMPMYYVNWGRYTQLTGQVLLPILFVLTLEALESGWREWRAVALAVVTISGLWLAHYVVTIFAILLTGAWLLVSAFRRKPAWSLWAQVFGLWALALLLIAPWLVNVVNNYLPNMLNPLVKYSQESTEGFFRFPPLGFFPIRNGFYAPVYLMLTAAIGAVVGLWRRERLIWVIVVWGAGLLVAANLFRTPLPVVNGLVDGFSVFIVGYITIASLVGALVSYCVSLPAIQRFSWRVLLVIGIVAASVHGAYWRSRVMDEGFVLVTDADLRAMAWIREQTPPEAKFLVNSFFATGPKGFVAGSDAGWWIPLLAQRQTNLLPANYMYEQSPPEVWAALYELAEIKPEQVNTPAVLATLRRHGIDHVYLGQKGGRFKAEDFQGPAYTRIYDRDGVVIFVVQPIEK